MADIKDSYILTLEKKMAELCGIDLCEIRKNQVANALDEAKSIVQMASYVEGISVQKQGAVQSATANPNIDLVYKLIKRELGENRGSHALPPLKYGYSALEPHISGAIMEIHHTKHHNGYITNLINATKKLVEAEGANDVKSQNDLFTAINFNGGGHLNHTIFWTNMSPNGGGAPSGPIADAINKDFGSFEAFKEKFSSVSVAVKGSGWGWLGFCPTSKKLQVASCQNQDPLQVTHGLIPLLGLDVWEHAYYLQYKNLRAEYVKAFFNVINWENVNERYVKAQSAAQL